MKPELLSVLHCPDCSGELNYQAPAQQLICLSCGMTTRLENGIPIFSEPPAAMVPSEKIDRGPGMGTAWRQANWKFLHAQVTRLSSDGLILDVGAGRGDFSAALQNHHSLALEVYPYPEVDLVCDLTRINPFRPASFEAVLLLNVLEHVYDSHALLETLSSLLKPGGVLIIAVPFMVKLHQTPVDFVRYTHFALQRLGEDHSLQMELIEGYYDPVFFLGEGLGNIRNAALPEQKGFRRWAARFVLAGIQILVNALQRILGPGRALDPSRTRSMAPTGYQIVFRKKVFDIYE